MRIATFFLREHASHELRISESLRQWFLDNYWPGEVRELRNICRYLAAHAWGSEQIELKDLPDHVDRTSASDVGQAMLSQFECEKNLLVRDQIEFALKQCEGRIIHGAKLLGMNRNIVSKRMKEYGLHRKDCSSQVHREVRES